MTGTIKIFLVKFSFKPKYIIINPRFVGDYCSHDPTSIKNLQYT